MPGEDQQVQTQSQRSETAPWDPARPLLNQLIAKYSGVNTDVTGGQSAAAKDLTTAATNLPGFGTDAAGTASRLFNSDTSPQIGMLSSAYDQLQGNLGGIAGGAGLDPYSTPGFSDAITTMMNDIQNRVKGVYAGAGRDPSGAGSFSKALGRGISEGVAPTIASQFNTNRNAMFDANKTLFGGAGSTAQGITGQQQVPLANAAQAVGLLPSIYSAFTQPAQTRLGAENTAFGLPFANLAQLLAPATQLGGMGSSSTGSATGTVTQPQSTMGNIIGGASTAIGLLSLLSDERAKTDIEPVGELYDGQPVFRYRYKDGGPVHIGLIAQEVADDEPSAVTRFGNTGLLAVNYTRATQRAADMARTA